MFIVTGVVALWSMEAYGSTGDIDRVGTCRPNSVTWMSEEEEEDIFQ